MILQSEYADVGDLECGGLRCKRRRFLIRTRTHTRTLESPPLRRRQGKESGVRSQGAGGRGPYYALRASKGKQGAGGPTTLSELRRASREPPTLSYVVAGRNQGKRLTTTATTTDYDGASWNRPPSSSPWSSTDFGVLSDKESV